MVKDQIGFFDEHNQLLFYILDNTKTYLLDAWVTSKYLWVILCRFIVYLCMYIRIQYQKRSFFNIKLVLKRYTKITVLKIVSLSRLSYLRTSLVSIIQTIFSTYLNVLNANSFFRSDRINHYSVTVKFKKKC